MPYATQQDMVDRFDEAELIQLTDKHNTGAVSVTVLNQALADADAKIDGYLIGRYTLPLTVFPVALKRYACDIARYFLYDDHPTEAVTKKYDDAISYLRDIAKGTVTLGLDVTQQPTPTVGGPQSVANDRVFSKDTLKDFDS